VQALSGRTLPLTSTQSRRSPQPVSATAAIVATNVAGTNLDFFIWIPFRAISNCVKDDFSQLEYGKRQLRLRDFLVRSVKCTHHQR
jgi:hypothetical protein